MYYFFEFIQKSHVGYRTIQKMKMHLLGMIET